MNNFSPDYFFDLTNFAHAKLFKSCTFVWNALSLISSYLQTLTLGEIEVLVPQGTYLVNPHLISIGQGTIIEPGAYIKGPCIIGQNCSVRHGAYIRGNFIAGNECVIGHATEVKNAIMFDKAQAGHFAYLGDTILGSRVNLGAGTKCANLRLNRKNVSIYLDGSFIETDLKKFGAIIGDDSQIGCNSVTNPGTLWGKQVICYPCVNAGGFITSNQLIRSSQKMVVTPL
ncbi:putative acetyltransferase YaiX|uniref:UDP-N-acetylglucosamine diphosphorylase n=1 Tax=Neochlamydia sp. AcF84 TaxID=2315858 RepID=UPI00140A0B32|nr:UDP-N-acetylglucosamine diphosphorylase [Neochlamydia sp. AcF84]NGY94329.1 putative acetyltransferase YaiX [Neochlamydia sp. AcF84]